MSLLAVALGRVPLIYRGQVLNLDGRWKRRCKADKLMKSLRAKETAVQEPWHAKSLETLLRPVWSSNRCACLSSEIMKNARHSCFGHHQRTRFSQHSARFPLSFLLLLMMEILHLVRYQGPSSYDSVVHTHGHVGFPSSAGSFQN